MTCRKARRAAQLAATTLATLLLTACGAATSEPGAGAQTVPEAAAATPAATVEATTASAPAPTGTTTASTVASADVTLVEPAEESTTSGAALKLVARGAPGARFRFEFRRFDDAPWSPVPDARLASESRETVMQPVTAGADGTTPTIVWNARETGEADLEDGDNSLAVYDDVPFVVRAVDVASGKASTDHLVTIDRTPPAVRLEISPDAPEVLAGTTVTFRWKASEQITGYAVYDSGEEPARLTLEDTVNAPPTRQEGSLTSAAAGRKYFYVRARDTSGNWGLPSGGIIDFVDAIVTEPSQDDSYDGHEVLRFTQALAGTGTAYVCWQYRGLFSSDWTTLPTTGLTYGKQPIRSWPVAIPRGGAESFVWNDWAAAPLIHDSPAGGRFRTLVGGADNACDAQTATEIDTRDFFYVPQK